MPKIMKISWQLTKLLQKLSGLLFLAHPVYCRFCAPAHFLPNLPVLSPNFPCSTGSRWMAFGLQRAY